MLKLCGVLGAACVTSTAARCADLYEVCSGIVPTPCQIGATCQKADSGSHYICKPDKPKGGAAELYKQCDGKGFKAKPCAIGADCVRINDYFSQCLWVGKCGDKPDSCLAKQDFVVQPQSPAERAQNVFAYKHDSAMKELQEGPACYNNNGDEEKYPNFIGNFHKTLPHNEFGEVDPEAYAALLKCLRTGVVADCEAIPGQGFLSNALAGLEFSPYSGDNAAFVIPPPPSIDSAEMAAMYAELAWMAVLRDVPFSEFSTHPAAARAAASLAAMPGYTGLGRPLTKYSDGSVSIDPATQLFRIEFPGVLDGPLVSQFLVQPFEVDGITSEPMGRTQQPGLDYMTDWKTWLDVQNGVNPGLPPFDADETGVKYCRTARDLGTIAYLDLLFTPFLRALFIALEKKFPLEKGAYKECKRNSGFSTWGRVQATRQLMAMGTELAGCWYVKWQINRSLRPEAMGGVVHLHKSGIKPDYPIHPSLDASGVLDELFELNEQNNKRRAAATNSTISPEGTYLLPQITKIGSLIHPSYPAGHAVTSSAAGTVLKAWIASTPENANTCYPDPVVATPDGESTVPYVYGEGEPCLTIGGEINKLIHNIALARDMSGMHFRADGWYGALQGEAIAASYLQDQLDMNPECEGTYSFESLSGEWITLEPSADCKDRHLARAAAV